MNPALIALLEQLVAAAVQALLTAKGQAVTPENVEALRSTIVLLPPTS